jgi:hypothetical protein
MPRTRPDPHHLLIATAMYALLSGRAVAPPTVPAVAAAPGTPAYWALPPDAQVLVLADEPIRPNSPVGARAQGDLRIDCTGLNCPSGVRTHQAPVSRRVLKSENR